MHRQYIPEKLIRHSVITLEGEDARHLQGILRVQPGDRVEAFNGIGQTRELAVTELGRHSVQLTPVGATRIHPKPARRVTLFTAVFKPGRMDWLVEKAVELGAWQIIAFATERSVIRGFEDREPARWRRIAREALRQCGGVWETDITCVDFNAARIKITSLAQRGGVAWFGDLGRDAKPFRAALEGVRGGPGQRGAEPQGDAGEAAAPAEFGWCVGPEGDFTPAETEALRAAGAQGVNLGPNVLRCETAGIFGLCAIQAWLGGK